MKAPISWLKDYVAIDLPAEELAHKLTMAGAEVKALEVSGGWDNIVVGEVIAIEPHPQADRLKLATVTLGKEHITVVCGAPNIAAGQKVPFARVGAALIDPQSGQREVLRKAKIRGVSSEGMVCSERELGISDRHQGIMTLPSDAPIGVPLDEYMGDTILDLDITPNRPDLLSVLGIAREVAALTGKAMKPAEPAYEENGGPIEGQASVEIKDPDLCPRYCASLITGVKIGPSPPWLERRLLACGMRPINNIVDVTNYVLLEYGQPLHAFDYDNLADRKIIVRRAKNEKMRTLDEVSRELSSDMLVIADGMGPVAAAGIMGGAESEVTEGTTNVLIESACFNSASIRRTAAEFKLRSEASIRFEKGLSPDLPLPALRRATELMARLAGGQVAKGVIDVYPGKGKAKAISLTPKQVERVLGIKIAPSRIAKVLTSLGFGCAKASGGGISVAVPYWRTDIRLSEDLVEEVARIIGYDNLPITLPSGALPEYRPDPMRALQEAVRDVLIGCGMQEIITYSLTSLEALRGISPQAEPLKVANPITSEQECLRTTLKPGLLKTVSTNEKHDEESIRLFEVGKVYFPRKDELPDERNMLSGAMCSARNERSWHNADEAVDFFDVKGVLETLFERLGVAAVFSPAKEEGFTPGRQAAIEVGGDAVGIVGELHPRLAERYDVSSNPIYLYEIDLEKLLPSTKALHEYSQIPKFPTTIRDIAIVVDTDISANKASDIIEGSPLVARVTLFDVYSGKQLAAGKKSLAFRMLYQSHDRTLTDEEVNREQERILKRLSKELGATIR